MPRLSKIIGFIIAASAVLIFILSEVTERQKAAELLELRNSISKLCTWLDLRRANHITRSPNLVALSIPRPWQIHEPYDQTARVCRPSETVLTLPEAILALFNGHDVELTCASISGKPARVLALLTTTYVPEESTATSDFPQKTGV
ncbi:hypothetical protein N431DRAFT_502901 [Stipitochalara longipes BDJ]|nr:hypothetical protein N431DRAFT_502901 [Stipitochalara longipes BDJ]